MGIIPLADTICPILFLDFSLAVLCRYHLQDTSSAKFVFNLIGFYKSTLADYNSKDGKSQKVIDYSSTSPPCSRRSEGLKL